MTDFIVLGTDTDAGKTTFALLWLALFGDHHAYWKPLETGESDSEKVRRLLPMTQVASTIQHFPEPVAPALAARLHRQTIPTAAHLTARKPSSKGRALLIETFGSPFSPLNEVELQIAFVEALGYPSVLVSSSALGASGRTLQCLLALEARNHRPAAVVLVGPSDGFALEKIRQIRPNVAVFPLAPPAEWTNAGIIRAAAEQSAVLLAVKERIESATAPPSAQNDILAKDRRHVWHPYTPLRGADEPLVCTGAQDEFLNLADGRRVIDGISSWWTILHGHRFPPLMNALAEAARHFDHVHFAGVTHRPAVELAELLLQSTSLAGGRAFYSDNGSTAVEVALKMAYQFWCHHGEPGRTRFVGFEHGYHGDTFGAMAVGRDPVFFGKFEPLLFAADILPLDPERLDAHLRKHASETSAVIVEPLVQGAGGMRMYSPDLLRSIFEITGRHGVRFIADEVMTGGGRLGSLWAYQQAGIAPDIICAAKTLAGGVLSLAATLASAQVVAAFETDERSRTFFHGHSFTAHPLACAVALANWRLLTGKMPAAPKRMEAFWKRTLAPLAGRRHVKDVRILGAIAAIELDVEGGYLADVGRVMHRACLERDVLLRPLGNVLYAMPPFCMSDSSLDRLADAMIAAIDQASRAGA